MRSIYKGLGACAAVVLAGGVIGALDAVRAQTEPPIEVMRPAQSFPAAIGRRRMEQRPTKDGAIPKIVGGQKAKPKDFPWQAALIFADAEEDDPFDWFFCGGSLIDWRWVLTAAHCTYKPNPKGLIPPLVKMSATEIHVYLGSHNFSGGQRIAVRRIFRDDDYDPQGSDYDIALLELAEPANQTRLKRMERVNIGDNEPLEPGKSARVIGWGSTEQGRIPPGSRESARTLNHVRVWFQDPYACNKHHLDDLRAQKKISLKVLGKSDGEIKQSLSELYPDDKKVITDNMVCAGTGDGSGDACFGDSGGPLVIKRGDEYVQAGIVSWGPINACGLTNLYGVYVSLSRSRYADWIASTIAANKQ